MILSVASDLIAERILSLATGGTTILLNKADMASRTAMKSRAGLRNINIVCTIAELRQDKGEDAVFVYSNFS